MSLKTTFSGEQILNYLLRLSIASMWINLLPILAVEDMYNIIQVKALKVWSVLFDYEPSEEKKCW